MGVKVAYTECAGTPLCMARYLTLYVEVPICYVARFLINMGSGLKQFVEPRQCCYNMFDDIDLAILCNLHTMWRYLTWNVKVPNIEYEGIIRIVRR